MNENFESDTTLNALFDDDLSEDAVFVTDLEISDESSGFLSHGDPEEHHVDPQSICKETGTTYAYLVSHSRVRAAVKRPVRLCKFTGAPACLLALEVNVLEPHYRNLRRFLRFKAMTITLEFEDEDGDGDGDLGPDVVMFCPESFTGELTLVEHTDRSNVRIGIDISNAIPAGITLGAERQCGTMFSEPCHVSIGGETVLYGDKPIAVEWSVDEDAALRQGVPKKLKFSVAVTYTPGRAFKMKLEIKANLGFLDYVQYPTKGKESAMSIKIDPEKLLEQAARDKYSEEHGRIWHCETDDSELTVADLIGKTNLRDPRVGGHHRV